MRQSEAVVNARLFIGQQVFVRWKSLPPGALHRAVDNVIYSDCCRFIVYKYRDMLIRGDKRVLRSPIVAERAHSRTAAQMTVWPRRKQYRAPV